MAEGIDLANDTRRSFSFEEFRLMYVSAQHTERRRDELNRANSSLCTLIIGSQGAIAAWVYHRGFVEYLGAGVCFIVSVLGIALCINWLAQIRSLKALNGAKFEVMKRMAPAIVFPDYRDREICSCNPFDLEWKLLEEKKELSKADNESALSSSDSEINIPRIFRIFFWITAASAIGIALAKYFGLDLSAGA